MDTTLIAELCKPRKISVYGRSKFDVGMRLSYHFTQSKQKLDRFLTFFIRYVHSKAAAAKYAGESAGECMLKFVSAVACQKGELPQRFMNMVYDTLEKLRPRVFVDRSSLHVTRPRPRLVFPELKAEANEAAAVAWQQAVAWLYREHKGAIICFLFML